MILFRQKRQLIALWSCVVVLFSALAPAISQTLAAQGNPLMVACSLLNSSNSSAQDKASKYMPLSLKTSSAPSDYSQHPLPHSHAHPGMEAVAHASSHQPPPAMTDNMLLALVDEKPEPKLNDKADTTAGDENIDHKNSGHQNSAHGMVHCPYCNLMHHSPVFLSGNAPQLLSGNLSYEMPALYYFAPRPLFVWAATQPRGPPTLS